jgi:hypothetical protein
MLKRVIKYYLPCVGQIVIVLYSAVHLMRFRSLGL